MIKSRERYGLLLGFLGMCLFAGTLPATRIAVSGFNPLFLTAARAMLAGCAGLATVLITRRRLPPSAFWLEFLSAALCTVIGFPLFAALAMMTVPASHGGVVLGILPLATMVAAAIFAHERPSPGFWLASAFGALAVSIFMFHRGGSFSVSAGDVYLLGTITSGALGYTFSGRLAARMPGWEVISWQVVLCLPAATIATLVLWPINLAIIPTSSWMGLGYVGLVSQYTAFFVFNAALAISGIARIGQIMLLQPFAIIAIASLINDEPVNLETIAFAVIVVVTVLLGQKMKVTRR